MFISKKEAEERLKADRNLFREVSAADSPLADAIDAPEEAESGIEPVESKEEHTKVSIKALSHLDSLINPARPDRKGRPRARYVNNLEAQAAIAETGIILGSGKAASVFELSNAQAGAYGASYRTSNKDQKNAFKPELDLEISKIKTALAHKAADRLDLTLEALSEEKIAGIESAVNLARVAKDMAVIIEKCSEKESTHDGGVHFHIYRPEMQSESAYDTITVGAGATHDASSSALPPLSPSS